MKTATKDEIAIFVREYIIDFDATRAARAACGDRRQSRASIHNRASELLKRPDVRAMIDAAIAERAERLELDGDTYLRILHDLCVFDPADLYDAHGNARPIHQVPKRARMAITSMQTVLRNAAAGDGIVDRVLAYRYADRRGSVELMLRHLGLLVDRKETGKPGEFARLDLAEKKKLLRELVAKMDIDEPSGTKRPH